MHALHPNAATPRARVHHRGSKRGSSLLVSKSLSGTCEMHQLELKVLECMQMLTIARARNTSTERDLPPDTQQPHKQRKKHTAQQVATAPEQRPDLPRSGAMAAALPWRAARVSTTLPPHD